MILSYFCWHSLTRLWHMWAYISKGIGKGQLVTYHDCHSGGVEVYIYSVLTSGLDRGGWPMTPLPPFYLCKSAVYPLCRRLGGSRGPSGQVQTRENLLLSLGFEPQTVQPVVSHYTDYAVLAPGYISRTLISCTYFQLCLNLE